jgi:hypothetical protein
MNHQSPSYWWFATTMPAVIPSGMSEGDEGRKGGREGGREGGRVRSVSGHGEEGMCPTSTSIH